MIQNRYHQALFHITEYNIYKTQLAKVGKGFRVSNFWHAPKRKNSFGQYKLAPTILWNKPVAPWQHSRFAAKQPGSRKISMQSGKLNWTINKTAFFIRFKIHKRLKQLFWATRLRRCPDNH